MTSKVANTTQVAKRQTPASRGKNERLPKAIQSVHPERMQFTEEELSEFKRIYKEEFGDELSPQEVLEEATEVINLLSVLREAMERDDAKEA